MAARRKSAPRPSRCLLAVALLFGIVLMHGLGHPGEHAAPALPGVHAAMASQTPATSTASHASAASHVQAASAGGTVTAEPPHHSAPPAPAHGAGVTTLCLAVLGAGIALLLVTRGVLGRLARRAAAPPTAHWFAYALRAIPPPSSPGSLLTRLSLLRI